jgi:hypothetical protein
VEGGGVGVKVKVGVKVEVEEGVGVSEGDKVPVGEGVEVAELVTVAVGDGKKFPAGAAQTSLNALTGSAFPFESMVLHFVLPLDTEKPCPASLSRDSASSTPQNSARFF